MARTELFDRRSQRVVPVAFVVIVALLLVARIINWQFGEQDGPELVEWRTIGEATQISRSRGRPILYDFTADWCQPCQVMKKEVFSDPRLAKRINERFVPVRVLDRMQEDGSNSKEVQQLEEQYAIRAFPTIVFTDANGKEKGRMEGFRGAEHFEQVMESIR